MMNPVLDQERVQHLVARQSSSKRRALLAAWSRPDRELPLVDLEVTWVRLSTLNHRTKAEQMREIETKGRPDLFSADPMGSEAQAAQLRILKSQPGFYDLKADLRERGQQEPAVATAEGVLVNGNRRSAALRSLYLDNQHAPSRYVRCLVLPADATMDELVDLETELQIARDFREDYSWVNEALLIEELFNREAQNWDRVAARMHKDVPKVRAQYEKLQQLHQLVALSDGTRHHADFDENESAFEELTRHIRTKPKAEANSVRGAYFLGTLTGVNYRDLRHLQRPDAAALVRQELESDPTIAPLLCAIRHDVPNNGGDVLDDALGDAAQEEDLSDILAFFARKRSEEIVTLADGKSAVVSDLIASVGAAIAVAAQEADEDSKDAKALVAPLSRLAAAKEQVGRAAAALERARSFDGWNEADFQTKVAALKAEVSKLEARG
ncbi:MAG: ParB/RepB/Spo0J family partition protein [Mesorhizobium sp.]|uniref:ParB/RepB/Spo0J family partition protein n=1 Tax=unclassified Mesorhizobium TaxID=325217 RepID=UPI000F761233|nr:MULTISPECIES: ParB/RepB/Spo0J family partition protein [unclassified Mesorhizobium]AZN98053.1 ParB/RepB/Spo0J family partition protein [Mesorhizobium sp. M9A.F.Ca.ET.002.03.1.2]AZO19525.1 ParB/RepB/Spo0J family partition protein [Mesorhizobium sp. M1E.F.Ca.ET.045.02.1.1]RWB76263.1 MAG: ParB/RepB/Spo0J family partition protein [Mesorhizobium sp.]RWJ43604.1 MAG: ParB/RepB/Spo0J family partition protein [Mesorhizobium sp.]RWJ78907.1 MAG: ParB/RepB/Spo0J family partition protein [Mesorhizobium 